MPGAIIEAGSYKYLIATTTVPCGKLMGFSLWTSGTVQIQDANGNTIMPSGAPPNLGYNPLPCMGVAGGAATVTISGGATLTLYYDPA